MPDPPPPARPAAVVTARHDPDHPKRPLPPVTLSAEPITPAIETLVELRAPTPTVVSLYWSVPEDPGQSKGARSALHSLVKAVRDQAESGDRPHADRMSLRADADRLLEMEDLIPRLHGRTVAVFRSHQERFEEAVVLPGWVRDAVVVESTPYVRPLLAVLDEAHRYAVALVDREHGQLYDFYLGELEASQREEGRVLREPNFAHGDKEYGVHKKAEELAKRHYRQVAARLEDFVRDGNIELIVVGGHEVDVPAFLDLVPPHLRAMVVGTFVADLQTLSPGRAREMAQEVIDAYERSEEAQLVAEASERAGAGGLGAIGLEPCLLATNEKAVEHLLVQPDVSVPGRACDNCGWLGLEGDECPLDGHPTRAVPDVIDEMASRVFDSSGHVEHVYADTELRDQPVAALLRFPLPSDLGPSGPQ
jgi:hypothetical protein